MSEHRESTFTGKDGIEIYRQSWIPDGDPSCVIVILHGYAEHSTRYTYAAEKFTSAGAAVFALDHRGHGKSQGSRADIKNLRDFVDDAVLFVRDIGKEYPGKKLFMLGQSVGGIIAALFEAWNPGFLSGLILTSPGLILAIEASAFLKKIVKILARVAPQMKVAPSIVDFLSRDKSVVKSYINDPLVYSDNAKARTAYVLSTLENWVPDELETIQIPVLIMHAGEDGLISPESSRVIYERIASGDKTLKVWDGLYHEILQEPEKDEVIDMITGWVGNRL